MEPRKADILIHNGIVITMNEAGDILPCGGVAVSGDTIASVLEETEVKHWHANTVINAGGGIIMPGLVNTHTHASMTCFRGLADDLPLMDWLNNHIFPAEAALDEEKVYTGAMLACAEMIQSGTTCFCDMYLFEDAVARAAADAGLRAVVGEVLYDFPSPNYGSLENGFRYTETLIEKWRSHPLVSIAVEPHSPYLCAPELLQRARQLAEKHDIRMVIHVSETQSEVNQIYEKYGCTPIQHLENLGVLAPNLLACHCVVLSDRDIERIRFRDVKVSHNPESNMKLASGIAPLPDLQRAGICVGLGTDGCASNNNLDLFLEMDTTAKLHKVHTLDPTVVDAASVLKMCTIDGARSLGLEKTIGSLENGKRADIIVIDTNRPHLTPLYNPISHLVYAAKGSDVSHSLINGRVVLEKGLFHTLDIGAIMERMNLLANDFRKGV
jgi:5-methylthioadenosine/S-adenosylhomocysteine deaminase